MVNEKAYEAGGVIASEFYKGNYTNILSKTIDSKNGLIPSSDVAFVIGALTFRGRLDEAEATFRLFQGTMSEEARYAARFFLGVGLCRHSHHARGRAYIAQNLRAGGRHTLPRIRFYAWQGAGFYRLICSRFTDSLRHASRALNAALEANFLYGKTLASDLMAHSQVGPGEIRAAGESFRRALSYAELLGDGGIRQAVEVSLAIHSAQHGFDPAGDIAELERVNASVTSEDNYSKSRLLLELGRQHILRGKISRAKACLDDACRIVYASQNRRYGIILNLRYAFIMHLAGEHHQALNLVRNAAKSIDPLVDHQIATEVLGLSLRLLKYVKCPTLDAERAETKAKLAELTRRMDSSVNHRILERADLGGYNPGALIGDDPLGDLVDISASRNPDAIKKIVNSGYLLFLMIKLNIAPASAGLVVGILPGAILAYESGEMHLVMGGASQAIRMLLSCLAGGIGRKEDLIEKIWRYKYHPLKHDQLIYTAISRLRHLLGSNAHWIEATESGYRLREGLEIKFLGTDLSIGTRGEVEGPDLSSLTDDLIDDLDEKGTEVGLKRSPPVSAIGIKARSVGAGAALNYRQIGIIELLKDKSFVDVRTCSEKFGVSEVSARRDLSLLTQLGVLSRFGKGRATRYSLPQGEV